MTTRLDGSKEDAARQRAVPYDDLIDQVHLFGLHYLGGGTRRRRRVWPPHLLLRSLATNSEPRLQLAVVALLIHRPMLAAQAQALANHADDAALSLHLQTSILAAAALQRMWAFSLDLYQPGWQAIETSALARELHVRPPEEDFGRATLRDLDRLLAGGDPLPPDYIGAWEDVGRHVIDDLRAEEATRAP